MWVELPALLPWFCGGAGAGWPRLARSSNPRATWHDVPRRVRSALSGRDLQHCQAHGDACLRGDDPGAAALPRHGASGETVTVAPGIAALYAVPMSSRVTGLAACVIVVLMTFSNAATGSSFSASLSDSWASSSVVVGHAAPIGSAWPPSAWHRGPCPCGHYALPGDAALNHAAYYRHVAAP
jgi:hypothetical protein